MLAPGQSPDVQGHPSASVQYRWFERSLWDNTLCVLARAKAPRLYRTPLDENDTSKAVEIVRRFRCAVSCEVLRSRDENSHRLRKSSPNHCRVWKIT